MNKSPQYNQQIEPKQCKSDVYGICISQNPPGKWLSQHYLKINSGFNTRKNPKQQYLSESSHVQRCFIQQKAYLCLRPCSLDNNTLNRPSSA